jgi:hypothetical protein
LRFWAPEPEDIASNATAYCLVEGDYTARGHYCDFYEARERPATRRPGRPGLRWNRRPSGKIRMAGTEARPTRTLAPPGENIDELRPEG